MTLNELKNNITINKFVPTTFMVFEAKECPFLAKQYVKSIEKLMDGNISVVTSIYAPSQSSFTLLTNNEDTVYIVYADTFEERAEDYSKFEHVIVVCDKVDKSIADLVKPYVVKFPKLEEWQILDYAKTLCRHVEESDLLWLIKTTNNDIERITTELEKVALFNVAEQQKAAFAAIRFDTQADFIKFDLFSIVDALIEGNLLVLYDFVKFNGYNTIEPVVLVNRAINSLKNIILVSQNPGLNCEDCGMSAGQFRVLKYKYNNLNIAAIKQKLKFLTSFDIALKTSKLDMPKRDLTNYLINNMCYKITN
jgi:hypothetical protein